MSTPILLRLASAAVIAGMLAGCAGMPWQPPAYETAIKSYYEAHASERDGQCLAPYIDGFTKVQVVEDTPDRMVVDANYLYRDWLKDQRDPMDGGGSIRECVGYNQRSFVLDKAGASLQVAEMSGPRRS
jgi:hypothetical protein